MHRKKEEKFFASQIIAFELAAVTFSSYQDSSYSAVNVLTNSPKISDITKRDISKFNFPKSDEKYNKSPLLQISVVFETL